MRHKLHSAKQPAQHSEIYSDKGNNIRKPNRLRFPQLTFRESGKDQIIDL